jgi:hypothetical protein
MQWSFVTRGRFEDMKERAAEYKAERDAALLRLNAVPVAPVVERLVPRAGAAVDSDPIADVVVGSERAETQETAAPQPFGTPFDRLLSRFDKAGKPDTRFRARTN